MKVRIEQVAEDEYRLYVSNEGKEGFISFPLEKLEDLYYAVPINNSMFLRLILDNVCATDEDRQFINSTLGESGGALDELQKILQEMSLDEDES